MHDSVEKAQMHFTGIRPASGCGGRRPAMAALLLVPLLAAGHPAPPALLYSYDLTYILGLDAVSRFETVHTVAALGGLVNRDAPRLFTPLVTGNAIDGGSHADAAWRAYLTKPGEWLASTQWENISSLEGLITTFQANISAVVLYDPLVPATSNLASTAAGVEGLLPVCFRPADPKSVYSRLVAGGPRLPVVLNLTGRFLSTAAGPTPKIAAYRWARERWLTPTSVRPKANPAKLGYYADFWSALQGDRLKATPGLPEVANHDYFISQKAFFFDLSVWGDEAPVDDPTQPLGDDKAELVAIFEACYAATQTSEYSGPEMLHIGGFTPWWSRLRYILNPEYKYTKDGPGCPKCKHKGVETEWETMGIVGAYNAFDDGDACCVGTMANSALYMHYPLAQTFKQNDKPTVATLHASGYLQADGTVAADRAFAAYYAGDYDGAAWLYNQLLKNWDDPKRGQVPIGWAIDSELSMRFPVIYKHLYATKTSNDFFISGDSGAGYLNPTLLLPDPKTGRRGESNVTQSGAQAWIDWNTHWYGKFDLSFTGFLINGDQGPLTNASLAIYDSFSPDGVVVTTGHDPLPAKRLVNGAAWCDAAGTPVTHHVIDLPGNVTLAAQQVAGIVRADRTLVASSLNRGDALAPGASLTSATGGNARLHNQLDGNLVLIDSRAGNKPLWSTGTLDQSCAPSRCSHVLELSTEGVLRAVAANGTVVWMPPGVDASSTPATELIVQDDCNLVLKNEMHVLWASGTKCTAAAMKAEADGAASSAVGEVACSALRSELACELHPLECHWRPSAKRCGPRQAVARAPLFYILRNILKSASYMADVADAVTAVVPNMTFVDPYTLGLLVKCHSGAITCTKS